MGCPNYKEFTLNNCPDSFIVKADFAANSTILWELKYTDTGIPYRGEGVTDEDGFLTIPVDDEPLAKEMFQPYLTNWQLRCKSIDTSGNELRVVFCGLYELLVFNFIAPDVLPDPNNVIVDLECGSEIGPGE